MAWNLELTAPAQKDFQKLPPKDRGRVKAALLAMQGDPFRGDIKRLKEQPTAWREGWGTIESSTIFMWRSARSSFTVFSEEHLRHTDGPELVMPYE